MPFILEALGHVYGLMGMKNEAKAIVEELLHPPGGGYASEYNLALVFTGMGEREKALAALERAFDARDGRIPYVAREPRFDPIRSEAAFSALMDRLALPAAPPA